MKRYHLRTLQRARRLLRNFLRVAFVASAPRRRYCLQPLQSASSSLMISSPAGGCQIRHRCCSFVFQLHCLDPLQQRQRPMVRRSAALGKVAALENRVPSRSTAGERVLCDDFHVKSFTGTVTKLSAPPRCLPASLHVTTPPHNTRVTDHPHRPHHVHRVLIAGPHAHPSRPATGWATACRVRTPSVEYGSSTDTESRTSRSSTGSLPIRRPTDER